MSANPIRVRTRRPAESATTPIIEAAEGSEPIGLPREIELKVVDRPLSELRPSPNNAATHSDVQIDKIMASFERFRCNSPISVTPDGEIISGAGRYEAAKRLGWETIPTICLAHLSEAEVRAYRLADQRLAQLAGWDIEIQRKEFIYLAEENDELLDYTAFETAEIDIVLDPSGPKPKLDAVDQVPALDPDRPPVSEVGDLWLLDDHKVICGDARSPEAYEQLLGDALAQMVFTDPPYGCPINGHVSGLGRIRHREFVEGSAGISRSELKELFLASFAQLARFSQDGSIHYTCIDWAHLREILEAGYAVYDELKNIVVWNKTNAGMGAFYRSQHELIPVWKKGKAPHTNNVQLGRHGRNRSNVWTYPGANSFGRNRDVELAMHPTVKNTALVMDAIKDSSKPGGIVLDAFGGSGTTLIAAAKTKRRGYLIELDPRYVDLIVRRWQKLFKAEAHHGSTGLTFDEMARLRSNPEQGGPSRPELGEGDHGR